MAADSQGNDLSAVAIPVTGSVGIAPFGTPFPSPSEGASLSLTLDAGYQKLGLVTNDGGPQWAWEADGDPIEFWQDGYSIPSGLANVTLVVTAAQTDNFVRSIIYGKQPDENGFLIVDGGGHSTKYVIFTEEAFKNGYVRRRVAPNAGVQSVEEAQSTRGEVYGYTITFKINVSPELDNGHFGEWLISPSTVSPTITAATPADAATGDTVTITGTGLSGTTGVKFGSSNATSFDVVSATEVTAVMPTGSAGSAQITVTTPNGTATFPYTRG